MRDRRDREEGSVAVQVSLRIDGCSEGMAGSMMTESMSNRRPLGDRNALTCPGYKADCQANGGSPSFVESTGFALCAQTQTDVEGELVVL